MIAFAKENLYNRIERMFYRIIQYGA